eukprot:gene1113-425_t
MPPPRQIRLLGAVLDIAFAVAAAGALSDAAVAAAAERALACERVQLRAHITRPRRFPTTDLHRRSAAAALRAAERAVRAQGVELSRGGVWEGMDDGVDAPSASQPSQCF